ncbi:MAG: MauE/DoxX family redox-associated membrane protein [Solirubrobacteraceae bacterium]
MAGVLLALRILLALVLAVAGAAKLADRPGARAAVTGFGVPEAVAAPVAAVLPWLELAGAVLLIPSATAQVGAAVALALMLAFSAAIARSIGRGEAPECHCFGALHSEPAGPRTLARNLALAVAAGAALIGGPGTSATAWIGGLSGGWLTALVLGVALAAALASGSAFALRLLRRNGELLLRIDSLEAALGAEGLPLPVAPQPLPTAGLAVGTTAPDFALPDLAGQPVTLAGLRERAGDLLLVFTDPTCGPCAALLPQIATWQREATAGLRPVLISRGDPEANRGHARQHGLADVLLQGGREIDESFRVAATPSALIVAADGAVASPVHSGEDQIRALVAGRAQDAPLRTLGGEPVALSAVLSGRATTIVFWNPECGFCARMLDDLRALDRADRDAAQQLLVISTGDLETNRAMGLSAPILLDHGFAAGEQFGAQGTPSAVRVDASGRVDSPVAVGAEAVLALAAGARSPVTA